MKSCQRLFLLGLLVMGLTGCGPSPGCHNGTDDVIIFNNSNCTRGIGVKGTSPTLLGPGKGERFSQEDIDTGLYVDGDKCPSSETVERFATGRPDPAQNQ